MTPSKKKNRQYGPMSLGHQTKWHNTIWPTPTLIFYAGTFLLRYIYYTLWSLDGTNWTKRHQCTDYTRIAINQKKKKELIITMLG